MGRPHPIELRARVVDFVDEGHSHRAAARHFRVSPRFVNEMIKLRRETGGLEPRRRDKPRRGKLNAVADWVRARVAEKGEITLDALVIELRAHHGLTAHRSGVGKLLHRLGLSHKKRRSGRSSSTARTSPRSAATG